MGSNLLQWTGDGDVEHWDGKLLTPPIVNRRYFFIHLEVGQQIEALRNCFQTMPLWEKGFECVVRLTQRHDLMAGWAST